MIITTDRGVYIQARLGAYSVSGSYTCYDHDTGRGMLDETGVGTGTMKAGNRCNVTGGSGGPYSYEPQRAVAMKYGASCVAVTDEDPAPRVGIQRKSVTILRP